MADLIIRNALVLDGTGAPGVEGDVAVTGARISAVGAVTDSASTEIDAGGKVLAPGFVDVHTHDDGALLRHPGMEFKLSQGCTSLVIGNCGFSAIPAVPGENEKSGLIGVTPTWHDLEGFRQAVADANPAVNAMALIGHNTSRSLVMGLEKRPPTDAELDEMRAYVRTAMEQGACGFSTGLVYEPGRYCKTEEIVELATIFVEAGVPSFTATTREDVVTGLMATNQADENLGQFFRRIALGVEAAINGENLSSRPIFINGNERLSINYATARRVNVPLRYSTLSTTDIVGDFDDFHADRTYTLLEIIEEALANNLSLAAARKTVALAEQDVKSARSNYLPSVSVSATGSYVDPVLAELSGGQNPEYSTFGNVNLSQTLYSEAANANISIQKYRLKAGREELNADEMDLVLNVSNAYFNVLILKSNARIRKQNLELTKRNLAIAEEHFEAGQSGRVDILRFRSELAQNTQAQVDAIDGLQRGFFALNQLLNNPIDKNINVADAREAEGIFKGYQHGVLETFLDDPIIRQSFVRFLSEQAAANAPELRSLDYSIEATQRSVTLNGLRRFMPTVGASANYNRTFDQWGTGSLPSESILSDNYNVGVSVSIPLFDRNRESISRQTAIIQKQQLQLNRDNVALSIDANVRNAVSDLTTQISNIELSRVSEETAGESLELSQASYSSGAITLVQLLDAQNNYLQAQLSRATANYNYLISAIILERYIGYYFLQHTETQNEEFRQRFFDYQQRSEESK